MKRLEKRSYDDEAGRVKTEYERYESIAGEEGKVGRKESSQVSTLHTPLSVRGRRRRCCARKCGTGGEKGLPVTS